MNKKTFITLLAILVLVAFTAAIDDVPENIILQGKKKGPVEFPHKTHADAIGNCVDCHHQAADGTDIPEKNCRTCHDDSHKIKPMKAFHNVCLSCHKKLKKEGNDVVPTKCNQCHAKKK